MRNVSILLIRLSIYFSTLNWGKLFFNFLQNQWGSEKKLLRLGRWVGNIQDLQSSRFSSTLQIFFSFLTQWFLKNKFSNFLYISLQKKNWTNFCCQKLSNKESPEWNFFNSKTTSSTTILTQNMTSIFLMKNSKILKDVIE